MTAPIHAEAPGAVAAAAEGQVKQLVTASSTSVPDFGGMTTEEFHGYVKGKVDGFRDGWQACEDALSAAAHAQAARAVHALAKVPPRDHDADYRQAQRRADWWAARRGEAA